MVSGLLIPIHRRRMLRHTITLLSLLASVALAPAALDLTATVHEFSAQGILYQQLKFKDDKRTVTMELPPRWTFRGSPARLQLVPPDKRFAEATIEIAPLPPGQALDEAVMQALEQEVIASVPPASQAITVTRRQPAQLLDGKPAFQIELSYKALGETFRRTTTYVNLPESRLTFRVTATEGDFEKVAGSFHRCALNLTWE